MLKVIFLGQELNILQELHAHSHVQAIYFQPPRNSTWRFRFFILRYLKARRLVRPLLMMNRKRYRKWLSALEAYSAYDYALSKQIKVLEYPAVSDLDFLSIVEKMKPDLGVVANFNQKVPETLCNYARYGFINFHPSLLPKYRGPNPFERVILNGESQSGVTFHKITTDYDRGGVLRQEPVPVLAYDSISDLMNKSLVVARRMLSELLPAIEQEQVTVKEQRESEATYFGKLTKQERQRLIQILRHRHALKSHIMSKQ